MSYRWSVRGIYKVKSLPLPALHTLYVTLRVVNSSNNDIDVDSHAAIHPEAARLQGVQLHANLSWPLSLPRMEGATRDMKKRRVSRPKVRTGCTACK